MVNIRKRGKVYISKSGFKTKNEALMAGMQVQKKQEKRQIIYWKK